MVPVESQTQIGYFDYGPSYDVVAYGDYLYVAAGSQVRVYDISTKAKIENIYFEPVRLFNGYTDVGTFREKTPPVNIIQLMRELYMAFSPMVSISTLSGKESL